MRTKLLIAHQNKEGSQRALAARFKVSLSFIRNLLRQHRETGEIAAKPRGSMTRRYGRGEGGSRVYDDCLGNRGKNLTLIGAMSDEGLIATMTLTGGLDTASFLVYIERILLPQLWVGAIVVMDNLPVHHAKIAEDLIESVGARVKFLPPYSPDLSPIELC